jgi:hypothetical protein
MLHVLDEVVQTETIPAIDVETETISAVQVQTETIPAIDVETKTILAVQVQTKTTPALGHVVGRPTDSEAKKTKSMLDLLGVESKKCNDKTKKKLSAKKKK